MQPPFRIDRVASAVRAREVSASEIAASVLGALATVDAEVQAFTAVDPELVLASARELDDRLARGEDAGPLAGVPLAVKDLVDVAGLPTSYGTAAIPERLAAEDADCVRRLRAAGALVVGKARTSELAWRSDTPPTRNPTWPDLTPGGSSGGSAAAVAAGLVGLALGTDTGGSIRWPAVQCGLAGLKPTTGWLPLAGVLPDSPSLDCVGPLAPTAADLAVALDALGAPVGPRSLAGVRLGLVDDPSLAFVEAAAAESFEAHVDSLRRAGATLETVRLTAASHATAILDAISYAEGAYLAGLARGRFDLLSPEVRRDLLATGLVPARVAELGHRARLQLARQAAGVFAARGLDAFVLPACTVGAVRRGVDDGGAAWASGAFHLASATGQPALVVPGGDARPGGVQLVGRPYRDAELVALGVAFEQDRI